MAIRVLHGLTPSAGQPVTLARALNRIEGISAKSLSVQESKFGYDADILCPVSGNDTASMSEVMKQVVDHFDVFHFHVRGFYFDKWRAAFPTGMDLLALKAAGKRVFMHFRGSEVRIMSDFRRLSPYHFADENGERMAKAFPETAQRDHIEMISAIADGVFVVDPELRSYVPGAQIIERAIDLGKWQYVGVSESDRPLVVHAPSRRGVKGTKSVLAAVEELREKGLSFDFRLVENLTNEEAREVYRQADIVVDQLRLGMHGVLAVEAWALGKPVIAYIREDIRGYFGKNPPLLYATPNNIADVLETAIRDKALRKEMGDRGRRYAEQVHDDQVVAQKLARIYESAIQKPRPVDIPIVLNHIQRQAALHQQGLKQPNGARAESLAARSFRYAGAAIRMARQQGLTSTMSYCWAFFRTSILKRRPSVKINSAVDIK